MLRAFHLIRGMPFLKMFRTQIGLALTPLVIIFGLAACGSGGSSSTSKTPSAVALHASGKKTIKVVSNTVPRVLNRAKHPKVFQIGLTTTGVALDVADMGKPPKDSQGHIQAYLDRIPSGAYSKADLRPPWLFTVVSNQVVFRLPPAIQHAKAGRHRIFLALAKNNDVLFSGVKPTSVSFTLK
jgi:hypothetical protein